MATVAIYCWLASFAVFEACRFTTSDAGTAVMAAAYGCMAMAGALFCASWFF